MTDIPDIEQIEGVSDMSPPVSLLSRMTAQTTDPNEIRFDSDQIRAVMEMIIPSVATKTPGLPAGMTCAVRRDENGWSFRVNLPGKGAAVI